VRPDFHWNAKPVGGMGYRSIIAPSPDPSGRKRTSIKHYRISESDDSKAMYQWYAQWLDVLDLKVTPCVEDAEAGPILASLPKR
jgi:Protein of unknown function (DUF3303)